VRGFQAAVAALDRVIVAEMQGKGDDLSLVSRAADSAFDAGAVIIAANGNNGPKAGTVNTPANGHRVIGVGNFDVQTENQITGQSRGPAPDGRFKPDIQAPTNTETASNASDSALKRFGGTSGATPYAAGAAALLRNWLRGSSISIDPGQVYAQIILSGQQTYPFNNTSGAGPIRLPTDGWAWWGKVSVANGMTIDIPLNISGPNTNTLDGALWWPEWALQFPFVGRIEVHNDIDLHLVDPAGAIRASSISIPSVFERARVSGSVVPGTWKLRIRGYNVPGGLQTVYWAAAHIRL
jgi:serine protease AprX